jgi:hypothetical protein
MISALKALEWPKEFANRLLWYHSSFGSDVRIRTPRSEGEVALDVQEITGTTAQVAARLCNFVTGSLHPLKHMIVGLTARCDH